MGGEGLSFLSGPGHWEFSHTPMSAWATKLDLMYFFPFLEEGIGVGGWTLEEWEVSVITVFKDSL